MIKQNEKKAVQLPLTGPYRGISGDGCVAIELDLRHGCPYRESSYVAEILIDIYDDSIQYDLAITKEVKTCSCPHSPRAEVKYAILSDAVEAIVEVKLRQRDDPTGCCYVKGKIVALSDLGKVVLFESNDVNKLIGPSHGLTTIPLTRSVLAMPLEFLPTIKLDLHICSTGEIVKDTVLCKPNLDSEHHGQNGVVQVKLTCSD